MANKPGLAAVSIQGSSACLMIFNSVNSDGTGNAEATLGGISFLTCFVLVNGDKEFMFTPPEVTDNPADPGGASLILATAKKQ